MNLENLRLSERARHVRNAAIGPLGILAVDVFARGAWSVDPDDSLGEKALKAIPSVFVPAPITSSNEFNTATSIASIGVGTYLVQETTKNKLEIAALAVSAQGLSTTADALADKAGMLSSAEAARPDVGSSAIFCAFISKFGMDRILGAKGKEKLAYIVSAGAGALVLTAGARYFDPQNATTDELSHGLPLLFGGLWSMASLGIKNIRNKELTNDASAQALGVAVEDGRLPRR